MERIKFPGVEQRVCSTFFEILVTWLFCDFLLLLFFGRLLVQRERKEATQISACVAFTIIQKDILHFRYSTYSFVRMSVKSPRVVESIARKIYFIIGQSAVNASTHD